MSVNTSFFKIFENFSELKAVVTTASGGQGKYGFNLAYHVDDETEAVTTNRESLVEELGIAINACSIPDQTHSTNVVEIVNGDEDLSATDALITRKRGQLVGVMTADCLPVVIYDPKLKIIAAIHAGWKGLAGGILSKTVNKFFDLGSKAGNLVVGIGPHIQQDSFEVGGEVVVAFGLSDAHPAVKPSLNPNKYLLNLGLIALEQLKTLGLATTQVEISSINTRTDNDYFSARRSGFKSGRFVTALMFE